MDGIMDGMGKMLNNPNLMGMAELGLGAWGMMNQNKMNNKMMGMYNQQWDMQKDLYNEQKNDREWERNLNLGGM